MTKLTNVAGRADYISNPQRQEEIVIMSETIDWKPYHDYEKSDRKGLTENNQARELIIALPNEWEKLEKSKLFSNVKYIAEKAVGKDTDLQWAVHWNKARTNLHVHVIFSERKLLSENKTEKIYDRDIYLTANGKVARNKSDRAKDNRGKTLPPVHRKGDKKGVVCEFSIKNVKYKSKAWLESVKTDLKAHYKILGFQLDDNGLFHQYHEGKGSEAPSIRKKNTLIKRANKFISNTSKTRTLPPELLSKIKRATLDTLKSGKFPILSRNNNTFNVYKATAEEYNLFLQGNFMPYPAPTVPYEKPAPSVHQPEPFDTTSVIRARDKYAETYLFYAYKMHNKADNSVFSDLTALKKSLEELPRVAKQINNLQQTLSNCGFFQKKKKQELLSDIDKAASNLNHWAKIIEKQSDTINFSRSEHLDIHNPQEWLVNDIITRTKNHTLPKYESAASGERRKQEMLELTRHIEYIHVEAAYNDLVKTLEEIPSEHRSVAYMALQTPYKAKFNTTAFNLHEVKGKINKLIENIGLKPLIPKKEQEKILSVENLEKWQDKAEEEIIKHRGRGGR